MTDLTPAVRLYAALHNIKGRWVQDGQKLTPQLADILPRLAAEHEKIVAERLAAVVAERDAAIAERDRLYSLAARAKEIIPDAIYQDWHMHARAALNPEAKS